jgi:hypothetical protein
MKKMLLIVVSFMLLVQSGFAQGEEQVLEKSKKEQKKVRRAELSKNEEGVIQQKRHFAFGGKLHNDGYGGFFEIGRAKSLKTGLLFQLDITERKHTKEEKINVNYYSGSPVIYGKINYVYPVKLGVQYSYLLGNKGNKNGVSVTANLGGGLSLAMLRPYMLSVQTPSGETKYITYEDDSTTFVNGPIVDGPGFGRGWSRMKVVPGIYVKPAFRFDYGRTNEMLTAIEVGMSVEYYTKAIEQMIFMDPKKVFVSGYVAIMFGKRKK